MALVEPHTKSSSPPADWAAVLHDWTTTVDHKKVGILYVLLSLVFLVIAGIEALGAQMPGHEKLIVEMKADGKTTPEQAAVRLVTAEGIARQNQLKGVKDVETLTRVVQAAPHTPDAGGGQPKNTVQAQTPDGWKAEYAASPALQSEFLTVENYVAFKANEGNIRILGGRKAS